MKVGDLVQQGSRVMEIRKSGKKLAPPKRVGIVLEIHELPDEMHTRHASWAKFLGRAIDVMWDNGKITEGFAENSLEVISDESR